MHVKTKEKNPEKLCFKKKENYVLHYFVSGQRLAGAEPTVSCMYLHMW